MNKLVSILKLMRWPNLVIILLAEWLFISCLIYPYQVMLSMAPLCAFCFSAVWCAAAGNIINDYYDRDIDLINKPDKVIIGRKISPRTALFIYCLLNLLGLGCALFVDWYLNLNLYVTLFVSICILMLWLYSRYLKCSFFIGNIVVAALTTSPLILLTWIETLTYGRGMQYPILLLFICFSFWMNLIREIIKDCEDMEGDQKANARTVPLVLGIKSAQIIIIVFVGCLIALLLFLLGGIFNHQLWILGVYVVLLIVLLLTLMKKIGKSKMPADFHQASSLAKIIMVLGILSMLLVRYFVMISF